MAPSDVQSLYRQYGDEIRRYLVRRARCADTAADLTQVILGAGSEGGRRE